MATDMLLYLEINLFCIAIMLLVFFKLSVGALLESNRRLFLWLLLSNIIFFFTDFMWVFAELGSGFFMLVLNWTLNEIYFIFSVAIGYSWFCYSEARQESVIVRNKKITFLCAIPLIAFAIMSILSIETGWLFYIDSNNVYHRGPLYFIQPVLGCSYAVFTSVKALWRSLYTESYIKRSEYRTLAMFVVPPIIGGIASALLPEIPLLCVGITLGTLYVYIDFQDRQIVSDPLTGLNNRNYMLQQFGGKIAHTGADKSLYFLMIDVDNFKQINDKFGHVEGDNALIIVADALKSGCQNYNSILSRYGGDEFAIICEINIDDDIKTLCRNIYNILESKSAELPYDLNLSIGFAKCSGDAKMTQEIIKAADAQLYKEKHEKNYPYLYELKHILCAKYRKKMFYGGGAMKKKIAFFDTKQYDRTWFDRINEHHGYEIVYFEAKLSEHTAQLANGFDAVCAFVNDDVNGSVIDILYNAGIRVLAMRCAGYNNVDVRAAEGRITILSVPAYSPHAVAEHSMALLQTLNRKLHKAYNRTRDFNFSLVGLTGTDLCGKTAGVIGTGKIGRVFIDICRGYGMKVLGYDLYPAENSGIEYVELDRLFQESDVISLHCPLTLQTKHIINEAAFQKMKEGVFIINTSRGALIDSTALLAALKNGKVKGAGLDVYEEEADIFFEDFSGTIIQDDVLSLLIASPNVLITSHQGFLTEEALENISKITLRNLDNFFGGQNQNLI